MYLQTDGYTQLPGFANADARRAAEQHRSARDARRQPRPPATERVVTMLATARQHLGGRRGPVRHEYRGDGRRRPARLVALLLLSALTASGLVAVGPAVQPAEANTSWYEVVTEDGELLNQQPLPQDEWTLEDGMFDGGGFHLSVWNEAHGTGFWEPAYLRQADTTWTIVLWGLGSTLTGGRGCSDPPFPFTSTSTTVDGTLVDTEECYFSAFNSTVWPGPWPVRFDAFPTAEDVDGNQYVFSRWEFVAPDGAACAEGNASLRCTYDEWEPSSKIRLVYRAADEVAPDVELATPLEGQRFILGEAVEADYSCTDDRDSAPTCEGSVENGAAIDTASVGPQTFTVEAEDAAGNTTTRSVTYHVDYAFGGFSGRVDGDGVNRAKAGSTVPLRFHLADADGTPIDGLERATVTALPVRCDDTSDSADEPLIDEPEGRAGLLHLGDGDYGWNWAVPRSYAGSCREVTVEFDRGGSATATFDLRR